MEYVGDQIDYAIAQSVEISDDKKIYIFHLKDSKWSDGSPLTAKDFERSWKKILSPSFPSERAEELYILENGQECKSGMQVEVGVKALDDQRLMVKLKNPSIDFLQRLTTPVYYPVKEEYDRWDLIVSNGAFKILDRSFWGFTLKKNEHFFDSDNIFIDKIQISGNVGDWAPYEMYKRGGLDLVGLSFSSIPNSKLSKICDREDLIMLDSTKSCFLEINTLRLNKELRQMIYGSISSENIVKLLPINFLGAKRIIPRSIVNEELSVEVRSSDAIVPNRVEISFVTNEINRLIAIKLQEQLSMVGIKTKLSGYDLKSFIKKLSSKDFDMAITQSISIIPHYLDLLSRFADIDHPMNDISWENSLYIHEIKQLADPNVLEAILLEEACVVPIYHTKHAFLKSPDLKNLNVDPMGFINLRGSYKEHK